MLDIAEVYIKPQNDMMLKDKEIISEHRSLMNENKMSEAVAYLNTNGYSEGARAFFYNQLENKIRKIQEHLKTKVNEHQDIESETEPSSENDWIKPY